MGSSPIQGLTATAVVEEGSILSGATTNGVVYVNASGQIATEAAFTYTDTTNAMLVDKVGISAAVTGAEVLSVTASATIASGASAVWEGIHVPASTATLSGSTNITTATGFNLIEIEIPTVTSSSAITVTNAATLTILGAPAQGGSTTITNAYALWVQAGTSRLGGQVLLSDGSDSNPSWAFTSDVDLGAKYVSAGIFDYIIGGTARFRVWGNGFEIATGLYLGFGTLGSVDLTLYRGAANTLEQYNGTNAQLYRIYNTRTDGSNYERATLGWSSNVFSILVGAAGSGASRQLNLGTDATSSLGIAFQVQGVSVLTLGSSIGAFTHVPGANTSGTAAHFTYTGPADTGQTASTEATAVVWGGTSTYTRTWAAGNITLQREYYIQAPTLAITGGASTITDAVTLAVSGAPIASGSPATTITRRWTATFGTLEATVLTPTIGSVGVFGAGTVHYIARDTTNDVEGFVTSASTGVSIGASTNHSLILATNNATRVTIAADGTTWTVASATLFSLPSACNLTVGAAAIASGTNTVQVTNGTAPTSTTADCVQFYSSDISAGNTEPSFYCEGTAVLATGQADSASSVRVKMRINGTEVTLLAI